MLAGSGLGFRLGFLTSLFCATTVASLNCASGNSGGSDGRAGAGAGPAGSAGGGNTGAAGAAGSGGTTGAVGAGGMTASPVCTSYCTTIMANCTGVNQQYSDIADCLKVCSYMPAGKPTDVGFSRTNSAFCRIDAATRAASDSMSLKEECIEAGPLGGSCGTDCDVFCTVALGYCSAASGYTGANPYASVDDCLSTCRQVGRVIPGTPGAYGATYVSGTTAGTKDTLECRAYYLFIKALQNPASQQVYCPDVANTSAACGPGGLSHLAMCTTYCTTIMANCTGENQQYADMANCMKACSFLPPGAPKDEVVNSIGCRTNYAVRAATEMNECQAAGPFGFGGCGNPCDGFCAIVSSYCSPGMGYTGAAPYQSLDDCETTCSEFFQVYDGGPGTYGAMYTPGPTSDTQDTFQCRSYHLIVKGLQDSAAQTMECPNAANVSPACGPGIQPITIPDAGISDAGTAIADAAVDADDGGPGN